MKSQNELNIFRGEIKKDTLARHRRLTREEDWKKNRSARYRYTVYFNIQEYSIMVN